MWEKFSEGSDVRTTSRPPSEVTSERRHARQVLYEVIGSLDSLTVQVPVKMVFFRSLSETIIRPYFLGSNAYVLPGVALVLYFYAKLSLGGKKKAIKDDKKGH